MVRDPNDSDRVRLAPADWGGLCSLALAILMLVSATLYQVHDQSAADRAREARVDVELRHLKEQVRQIQEDIREFLRSHHS